MKVNIGGTWKDGRPWVNVGGTWKRAIAEWVNVNGVWKKIGYAINYAYITSKISYDKIGLSTYRYYQSDFDDFRIIPSGYPLSKLFFLARREGSARYSQAYIKLEFSNASEQDRFYSAMLNDKVIFTVSTGSYEFELDSSSTSITKQSNNTVNVDIKDKRNFFSYLEAQYRAGSTLIISLNFA
ncbi:hypothetical protein [Vibrio phage vB_VpM-pA2SJ1]|uniref:Tail fiber protein n=1 Tax=Vibrio phage vB_VpM-pA2SJ1 TaxID=3095964 RepID=A0AAX4J568_9CAUD